MKKLYRLFNKPVPLKPEKYLAGLRSVPTIFDYLNLTESLNYIFTSRQAYEMFRTYCGDHVNSKNFSSYLDFIQDPKPLAYSFIRFLYSAVEADNTFQLYRDFLKTPSWKKLSAPELNRYVEKPTLLDLMKNVDSSYSVFGISGLLGIFNFAIGAIIFFNPTALIQFLEILEQIPGNIYFNKEMMLAFLKTVGSFVSPRPQEDYINHLSKTVMALSVLLIYVSAFLFILEINFENKLKYAKNKLAEKEMVFVKAYVPLKTELSEELRCLRMEMIEKLISNLALAFSNTPQLTAHRFLQYFSTLNLHQQADFLAKIKNQLDRLALQLQLTDRLTEKEIKLAAQLENDFACVVATSKNLSHLNDVTFLTNASCRIFKALPKRIVHSNTINLPQLR